MHLIVLVTRAFVHQLLDVHSRYSKKYMKEGWKCFYIFNPQGTLLQPRKFLIQNSPA